LDEIVHRVTLRLQVPPEYCTCSCTGSPVPEHSFAAALDDAHSANWWMVE
jgi:hypothetical protein